MRDRLSILVDMDNCINNLMEATCNLFNKENGTYYALESFQKYSITDCIPEEHAQKMQALFVDKRLWDSTRPAKGSQSAIKRMKDNGDEVLIVTATHFENVPWKAEWLAKYFPFIEWRDVIVAAKKSHIVGDWMIDDCLNNLLSFPYGRVCIDKPWNRNVRDDVYDIIRVDDLNKAYDAILEREKQENE